MRKAIFASLLALAGLLGIGNTASAQVVYYSSGYTPYYYGSYYPAYGGTVYSTPGITTYYRGSPVVPAAPVVAPSGVVTTSYYMPAAPGYTTYSYPYTYTYGYAPYYGYSTRSWGWRRW
jgi:hypothetical protein